MAKQLAPCMFCEKLPCECNGPAKKKITPSPKKKTLKVPEVKPSTEAPEIFHRTEPKRFEVVETHRSVEEVELAQAISNVWDILSQSSKSQHADKVAIHRNARQNKDLTEIRSNLNGRIP